jgi:hypothetical protein
MKATRCTANAHNVKTLTALGPLKKEQPKKNPQRNKQTKIIKMKKKPQKHKEQTNIFNNRYTFEL